MAKRKDTAPDRGALDLRGLLCLFIGLVGAIAFYANDLDGTRASVWLVLFGGGGIAMISRAFKQEKLAGLILILSGIGAAALLYTDDASNLTPAIVLLLAGLGAGAFLMLPTPR
jgi:hypothetical protein